MEVIFRSRKPVSLIFIRLLLMALIPSVVIGSATGVKSGFSAFTWIYAMGIAMTILSLRVFITYRYYILEIQLSEDVLTIKFLYWFREKTVQLNKSEIYFRLNDFYQELKYFEIVKGDKLIIKQAPFLEWKANNTVKEQLEQHGFRFRTYW